eukprot:6173628-Pleurochrysis_carterae.AAC.3
MLTSLATPSRERCEKETPWPRSGGCSTCSQVDRPPLGLAPPGCGSATITLVSKAHYTEPMYALAVRSARNSTGVHARAACRAQVAAATKQIRLVGLG